MKDKFIKELKKYDRPGMDELIAYMEAGGFFEAPSSGKHHLCREGGLLTHTMNVLLCARKINRALGEPVPDKEITITALLHDLGKMGDHGKPNYVPNILKSGNRSEAEPFKTNDELPYIDHAIRSVIIARSFIELSAEEEHAILYHNGLYNDLKYSIKGKETELYLILHTADMWASHFMEV